MSCEQPVASAQAGIGRRAVRGLRDVMQGAFEGLWGAGFIAARVAGRCPVAPLDVGGGESVLVVAPHPDDEVAGCGGVIARHVENADRVTIAWTTDGRRSTALALSPDRTAAARRAEAEAAAAELQVRDTEWIGLREGEWGPAELAPRLRELLRSRAPTLVYAPSRIDFHPEHRAVAHALARALESPRVAPASLRIRIYQVQVPLGASVVNRVADVSGARVAHDAALARHASQRGSLSRCGRMKRYAARAHAADSLAEEFREVSVEEYLRWHLSPVETWNERFRGLRFLAFADPAAYLVGRKARRRLVTGP